MANHFTSIEIRGYIVGGLYWPMGAEAFKDFHINVTRQRERIGGTERATLADVVDLSVTEDSGDFCGGGVIAQGELIARRHTIRDGRSITVERRWPLESFPSLADYLHPNPDWWPAYELEEAA